MSRLVSGSGVSGLVSGLGGFVVGLTLVSHIGNISRVSIGNVVGDDLGAAIGQVDTVFALGGVVVAVLVGGEVSASVVISNSIAVLVDSGSVFGLLVGSGVVGSGLVSGSGMGSGLVSGSGVGSGLVSRSGSMVGWGGVVHGSGMISGSVVHGSGMVSGSVMDGSGVVGSSLDVVGGSVDSGRVLLLIVGLVDLGGLSRGLADHGGVGNAVGFVDGGVDSGGVAVLDGLVAALVGRGHGEDGEDSDESLEKSKIFQNMKKYYFLCFNALFTFMLDY